MKKFKKLAALLLATLTTLSVATFVSCNDNNPTSDSTPTPTPSTSTLCTNNRPHSYAWDADDIGEVAKEMGQCTVCGQKAVIPDLPADQSFPLKEATSGNDEYSPLDLTEGCYTLEIPASGEFWVCFSATSTGQFAFYSINGENATAARYVSAYVGISACYFAADAKIENNNFYSYVNRSESEVNSYWRTVFCIKGTAGSSIKVCFTRIADPIWTPKKVTTMVYPTEINGKKAAEPEAGKELVAVDYEENYFFDESVGYYRMGTKTDPGEIIYAAITMKATRIFSDKSFIDAFVDFGAILTLNDGYTAEGNYNQLCYNPFISNCANDNDPNNGQTDNTKNCYMNFVNSNGVYPVTKELYQFLNLYVRANCPITVDADDSGYLTEIARDWREHKNEDGADENRNKYWLAACYYYGEIQKGTQKNPHLLTAGETSFTIPAKGYYYVTLPQGDGVYKVESTTPSLQLYDLATNTLPITVKGGITLRFGLGINGGNATVTVTEITEDNAGVSVDTAEAISLGNVTLTTTAIYNAEGTAEYYAYYEYVPTQDGTLTLTATTEVDITVGSAVLDKDTDTATLTVTKDEPVIIYVSTQSATDISVTLSLA